MVKRIVTRIAAGLSFVIITLVIFTGIFFNEIRSLLSINKLHDHPFYSMTYYGNYGFDDFLEIGATSDQDIEDFVIKRILKGMEIDLGISSAGCTAFTATNEKGENIFTRNFDYAPSLLLFTNPSNGYKSISIVNLSYIGYHESHLPRKFSLSNFFMLATPYLPFDGINEKGVVMALLTVPFSEPPKNPENVTLNTTTAIRLILDKAASTEEAIQLLQNYNYYFSGDIDCHYLISDQTGDSVIVEFMENDIKIIRSDNKYQIASNFIQYNNLWIGEGFCEFERDDKAKEILPEKDGIIGQEEVMQLLKDISIPQKNPVGSHI